MRDYVTVYVWVSLLSARSPGHVALSLLPFSKTPADGYVSFAPRKAGNVYGPGHFYSRAHDTRHYAKRGVWVGKIYGLDVAKMTRQFSVDWKQPSTYSLLNECASVVHRYLKLGGGDDFAGAWSRVALITWSPDDAEDYARSIVKNTAHLGSFGVKSRGEGTIF